MSVARICDISMLKIEDLKIPEVEAISLMVGPGECLGLSGDSGCGKTRLLRAIADMDEHGGEVYTDEVAQGDVSGHEWRCRVSLLPAESLWWFDSVGEHFHVREPQLQALGFGSDVLDWQVSRCSSGEKQRLAVARMLTHSPRVLLLDEPTANLDAKNTVRVESLIQAYLAAHNAMAIWVSHDPAQLARMASTRYRLTDGRLQVMDS
jgi:ABC-type iron transport system FetAB ATPase subunit